MSFGRVKNEDEDARSFSSEEQRNDQTERNSLFPRAEEESDAERSTGFELNVPLLGSSSSLCESQALITSAMDTITENLSGTDKFDVGEHWCKFVCRYRYHVFFIAWALIIPAGLFCFPRFIRSTDSTMHPIPGSYSDHAIDNYRKSFGPLSGFGLMQDDPMNDGGIILLLKQTISNSTNVDETLIDGSSDTFIAAQKFSLDIQDYVESKLPIPVELRDECYTDDANAGVINPSVNATSYYSLMKDRLTLSATKFSAADGHSTIIHIGYSIPSCLYTARKAERNIQMKYGQQILESVQSYVDDESRNIPDITMGITGMLSFKKDMSTSLSRDMHRMHFIILPLALVLFSITLGGHPMLVMIPIFCVLCVICSWSAVMVLLIRHGLQVTQFTPNVMITLTFGLSIDYSLFLLSRAISELKYSYSLVGEELVSGEELRQRAISTMIRHVGHIIMTSGITLISTFLGLLLFPIHSLHSVSIGAIMSISMCMIINMVFVPALLCSDFGAWVMDLSVNVESESPLSTFLNNKRVLMLSRRAKEEIQKLSEIINDYWKRRQMNSSADHVEDNEDVNEYTSFRDVIQEVTDDSSVYKTDPLVSPQLGDSWFSETSARVEIPGQEGRFNEECVRDYYNVMDTSTVWFRLGNFIVSRHSGFLLLAIVCTLFPISVQMRQLRTSISINYLLPRKSSSFSTLSELRNIFGEGVLSPYQLVVRSTTSEAKVDSSDGFETIQNVVKVKSTAVQANFTGIAWANHKPISHSTFEMARECAYFWECPIESLRELAKLYSMTTTANGTSTSLTCILSEDPFSDGAIEWLVSTRKKLEALEDSGSIQDFEITLEGGSSIYYDAKSAVNKAFPEMLASIVSSVIILLAVFFRSVSVPLRSVLTIILTVTSSYGVLSIMAKRDLFGAGENNEISWMTPILSINMIVGLAIDYDVFLTSSILEARIAGHSHNDSIISGVYNTGNIITAAGCIMGVSFGGLILSESRLVQEWSLVLTVAVLIDTFVIRSCVVPILTVAMGRVAWWPRKIESQMDFGRRSDQ